MAWETGQYASACVFVVPMGRRALVPSKSLRSRIVLVGGLWQVRTPGRAAVGRIIRTRART